MFIDFLLFAPVEALHSLFTIYILITNPTLSQTWKRIQRLFCSSGNLTGLLLSSIHGLC